MAAGKATPHELRTVYDLNDVADFHELLDAELAMQKRADAQARGGK